MRGKGIDRERSLVLIRLGDHDLIRICLVKWIIFSFDHNGKCFIRTWKCEWIGLSYSSGQSERREEILERRKWSNYFERIEREAVWGENLKYDYVQWQEGWLICLLFHYHSLKRPNSASRKVVRVWLTSRFEITTYLPRIGHNPKEHFVISVREEGLRIYPVFQCEISHYSRNPKCCWSEWPSTRAF